MNWADMCFLMTILVGAMGGFVGARTAHAGVATTVVCAFGGLLVGFGLGAVSNLMAYSILRSKRLPVSGRATLYLLVPMLLMLGTVVLVVWLVLCVL